MPVYQYTCTDCKVGSEAIRGIRDSTPDLFCKTCNSALIRVYSSIGVIFNGSGFYQNDNRKA